MSVKKARLTYDDYVEGIWTLNPDEHLRLIELISTILKKRVNKGKTKHSILELEGLGADIWKDIDAQKYVQKERESWD